MSVSEKGPAARAGLLAGDVLVSARSTRGRAPSARPLRSFVDARLVEAEEAQRGPVELTVLRDGRRITARLFDDSWHATIGPGPNAPESERRLFEALRAARAATEAATQREAETQALALATTQAARALVLDAVADRAATRGDRAAAEAAFREAVRLLRRDRPSSLLATDLLQRLGLLLRLSDSDAAERVLKSIVAVKVREAPDSPRTAMCLNAIGTTLAMRGRYGEAKAWYQRALRVHQRRRKETLHLGTILTNLGDVTYRLGDVEGGERYCLRALAVMERVEAAPGPRADVLRTLGVLARFRGQLDVAEDRYQNALDLLRGAGEGTAGLLVPLANVKAEQGDYEGAVATAEQALAEARADPVGQRLHAGVLGNLAGYHVALGHLDRAEALVKESFEVRRRVDPDGGPDAGGLILLHLLARNRGDMAGALRYLDEARAAVDREAPESLDAAQLLAAKGELLRITGRVAEAESALRTALAGIRRLRPGSLDEAQTLHSLSLLARSAGREEEGVRLLLEAVDRLDRQRERLGGTDLSRLAFGVRSRDVDEDAVATLVSLGRDAEALSVLERARTRTSARTARTPAAPGRRLPRDTLGLWYQVTGDRTFVLALGPDGRVASRVVPVGAEDLSRRVSILRGLLLRGREGGALEDAFVERSRDLATLLLGPASGPLADARRVLVSADGPLVELPFAALITTAAGQAPRFLGEEKRLSFADVRPPEARGPDPGGRAVVLGDPRTPPGLAPLPGARAEAVAVAASLARPVVALLGEDATEKRVKAVYPTARLLHFAGHAVRSSRHPLESGLALASGGGEDGLLTAREVLEGPRLLARLVTLSGCETAGDGGEALLGLVRAFEAAGAGTVLATLLRAPDEATRTLMETFYARLSRGAPPDEALRDARRALVAGRTFGHPLFWAGFQLYGDGR